jgi:hypothetical protein
MDISSVHRDRRVGLLQLGLVAILMIAFYLRASTLAFGLPSLNDQDELVFQMGAVRLLTTPTLNPKWFGHPGTTTIYGLALIDVATYLFGRAAGWWPDAKAFADAFFANPTLVILPGRAMILAFGLTTIVLTYRLGTRLFSPFVGLAAALILSVSPLHVAYSQIIRTDMMATAFMLLAVLQALRAARGEGGLAPYLHGGAWVGVTVATKWPFGLALLTLMGAALLRHYVDRSGLGLLAKRIVLAGGCAGLALIAISPFLVLDWPTVVANLQIENRPYHLGATGGSFWWNLQWYLFQPLHHALGLAGLVAAGAGLVLLGTIREARFVLLPLVLAFIVLLCSQKLIWPRWGLPLLPFFAIALGLTVERLAVRLANLHIQRSAHVFLGAATLAIALPLTLSSLSEGRERMNDTRQQASRWLMANVPPGHTVLLEHFGFDMLQSPYSFRWPIGDAGCIDPLSLIRTKSNLRHVEGMRAGRSNVDYGTVAASKLESCRADYAIITQYDRYSAERGRFPQEYAQYARLIDSAQTLAVFRPSPGVSGGWVVRVLKLHNTTGLRQRH